MMLILMTPVQAEQVRGASEDGAAALEPRQTLDGMFVLPARVLLDPAHAAHHALLSGLPAADVSEFVFPPSPDEDE